MSHERCSVCGTWGEKTRDCCGENMASDTITGANLSFPNITDSSNVLRVDTHGTLMVSGLTEYFAGLTVLNAEGDVDGFVRLKDIDTDITYLVKMETT